MNCNNFGGPITLVYDQIPAIIINGGFNGMAQCARKCDENKNVMYTFSFALSSIVSIQYNS